MDKSNFLVAKISLSAISHNMNFIGFEINEDYFNIAKERIEKAQHKDKGEKNEQNN